MAAKFFCHLHRSLPSKWFHQVSPGTQETKQLHDPRTSARQLPSYRFHKSHRTRYPPALCNGEYSAWWPCAAPWYGRNVRCRWDRSSPRWHQPQRVHGDSDNLQAASASGLPTQQWSQQSTDSDRLYSTADHLKSGCPHRCLWESLQSCGILDPGAFCAVSQWNRRDVPHHFQKSCRDRSPSRRASEVLQAKC